MEMKIPAILSRKTKLMRSSSHLCTRTWNGFCRKLYQLRMCSVHRRGEEGQVKEDFSLHMAKCGIQWLGLAQTESQHISALLPQFYAIKKNDTSFDALKLLKWITALIIVVCNACLLFSAAWKRTGDDHQCLANTGETSHSSPHLTILT